MLLDIQLLLGMLLEQERLLFEELVLIELRLLETQLVLCMLHELGEILKDDDGELLDELIDILLIEELSRLQEQQGLLKEELLQIELRLLEMQLDDCKLIELGELFKDEDGELQLELFEMLLRDEVPILQEVHGLCLEQLQNELKLLEIQLEDCMLDELLSELLLREGEEQGLLLL